MKINGVRIGVVFLDVVIYCLKLFNEFWINGYIMDKSSVVIIELLMIINGMKCLLLKNERVLGNLL